MPSLLPRRAVPLQIANQRMQGVYVFPDPESTRTWHGFFFIRQAWYAGGTFKFVVQLPEAYPADDALPSFRMTTPTYHPLISAEVRVTRLTLRVVDGRSCVWVVAHCSVVTRAPRSRSSDCDISATVSQCCS